MNKYKIGVAGFRGYSGAELVRLLAHHPGVEPVLLEHRQDQRTDLNPSLSRSPVDPVHAGSVRAEGLAVVFLATPADVSMDLAPAMLEPAPRSSISAARSGCAMPPPTQRWYKEEHTAPGLLAEAVYGLPEYCRERIRGARLIANPGCYPTAANLAIRPLIAAGVVDRAAGIVCDAKSGVSGAGRKPSLKTSFCEVTENFSAYSVLEHRHVPEVLMVSGIEEARIQLHGAADSDRPRNSRDHLLPHPAISSAERSAGHLREPYAGEPFVRLYPLGNLPDCTAVQRTNFCDIGLKFDAATGRAVVVSAIDNLVKGAAGPSRPEHESDAGLRGNGDRSDYEGADQDRRHTAGRGRIARALAEEIARACASGLRPPWFTAAASR